MKRSKTRASKRRGISRYNRRLRRRVLKRETQQEIDLWLSPSTLDYVWTILSQYMRWGDVWDSERTIAYLLPIHLKSPVLTKF